MSTEGQTGGAIQSGTRTTEEKATVAEGQVLTLTHNWVNGVYPNP